MCVCVCASGAPEACRTLITLYDATNPVSGICVALPCFPGELKEIRLLGLNMRHAVICRKFRKIVWVSIYLNYFWYCHNTNLITSESQTDPAFTYSDASLLKTVWRYPAHLLIDVLGKICVLPCQVILSQVQKNLALLFTSALHFMSFQ